MKKKIQILQVIRFMVQLGFLILLPGLFIQIFGEMKLIVTALLSGTFDFYEMLPGLLEMAVVIPLTILFGRFFCGWMCAFGTYNDIVYKLFSDITGRHFAMDPRVDKVLKSLKYLLLAAIVVGIWILGYTVPESISPWAAFGRITELATSFPVMMIGFGILGLITIGAAFVERFFCRYLCPLGASLSLLSYLRMTSINKPSTQCGNCSMCTSKCSMGIEMGKKERITSGECIYCMKCVGSCPRKNTKVNVFGKKISASLTAAAAVIGFVGIYTASGILTNTDQVAGSSISETIDTASEESVAEDVSGGEEDVTAEPNVSEGEENDEQENSSEGNVSETAKNVATAAATKAGSKSATTASSSKAKTSTTAKTTASSAKKTTTPAKKTITSTAVASKKYKDGTYTGTGVGYRPGTKVSVTIKSDKITSIKVVETNDDRPFYQRAYSTVIKSILSKQKTSVSTVSGATYSCEGLIEAVNNALKKAKI